MLYTFRRFWADPIRARGGGAWERPRPGPSGAGVHKTRMRPGPGHTRPRGSITQSARTESPRTLSAAATVEPIAGLVRVLVCGAKNKQTRRTDKRQLTYSFRLNFGAPGLPRERRREASAWNYMGPTDSQWTHNRLWSLIVFSCSSFVLKSARGLAGNFKGSN